MFCEIPRGAFTKDGDEYDENECNLGEGEGNSKVIVSYGNSFNSLMGENGENARDASRILFIGQFIHIRSLSSGLRATLLVVI